MKKNYTPEFKAKLVQELLREELTLSELTAGYGVHTNLVAKWRKSVLEGMPELFVDKRKRDKALSGQRNLQKSFMPKSANSRRSSTG